MNKLFQGDLTVRFRVDEVHNLSRLLDRIVEMDYQYRGHPLISRNSYEVEDLQMILHMFMNYESEK